MQTFLPYPSFDSVRLLDMKRLGKQRVEAKQILKALSSGPGAAWYNHPAVQMWKGYEMALCCYLNSCIRWWIGKGYKNTMLSVNLQGFSVKLPPWFGNDRFHESHRSNLMRKNPEYYSQFDWGEPDNLPYFWPTKEGYQI